MIIKQSIIINVLLLKNNYNKMIKYYLLQKMSITFKLKNF